MPKTSQSETRDLPKGGDLFVEAFARGLAVIRAFGPHHQHMTISDIAKRADITPAGARRLLHTLVTLGYAIQTERTFSLRPKVLEIGFAYLASLPLRDIARNAVEEFMKETGEICTVTVLDGDSVVYIARAEMPSPISRRLGVGERLPAHATSSGIMLLSSLTAESLEHVLANTPLERMTDHTLTEREPLLHAIFQTKELGYALACEHLELGICGLAVPILDDKGTTVAALTTSLKLAKHNKDNIVEHFLPRLRQRALQISQALGYRASHICP